MRLPGKGMTWKRFLKGLKDEISKDGITDVAATVTYYGVLALFPFLLFLVAVASVVIDPADAEKLVQELSTVAPGAVTQIVGDRLRQLGHDQNVTLLGFGAIGAIWAASGGVMALMRALNLAYDVKEGRPWWKVRGVALLMTLVSSVLAITAAVVAVASAPLAERLGGPLGMAITWLRLPVAGLLMMLLWALAYYVLPDVEQKFKFITPGSVVGVFLWVLASWAFSKYVASFGSYDKTYGSIAGVIVLLLWMWISSLVLLVGAEANALIEHSSEEGKRQGAKEQSDTGTTPAASRPGRYEPKPSGDGAAVPAHAARAADGGGREGDARRGVLRGLTAVAAGFAAGVLVGRRSEA